MKRKLYSIPTIKLALAFSSLFSSFLLMSDFSYLILFGKMNFMTL